PIAGARHIPLGALRSRMSELPTDKDLIVYCRSGQRSYIACRMLSQSGFRARNLSGAYLTWVAARQQAA
ncbi:MAG: CoA-disulfide reductase, partial [Armatimonadetes bacterium]|nr:CoA-disulfide reductase [Armatimonadota bacterium]